MRGWREGPHFLYRFYDASDGLLYVGIAKTLSVRVGEHLRSSAWARLAVRLAAEMHNGREAAASAELEAIRTESPLYNIAGRDSSWAARAARERLASLESENWAQNRGQPPYLQALRALLQSAQSPPSPEQLQHAHEQALQDEREDAELMARVRALPAEAHELLREYARRVAAAAPPPAEAQITALRLILTPAPQSAAPAP